MKLCLVIDDSSVTRKVARVLLNSIGYEVVEAETGGAGLDACGERKPDAIWIDWDLADMSGFDFLVQFGRRHTGPRPHIVYATTENDPVDISRAIRAGADDFVIVPFERVDIEAKFPSGLVAA